MKGTSSVKNAGENMSRGETIFSLAAVFAAAKKTSKGDVKRPVEPSDADDDIWFEGAD
jgi:hypothetical protein